jgi:ribosomal protein S18 acetylase RimI-like enzyme
MTSRRPKIIVRQTRPEDFDAIAALSRRVYPDDEPWRPDQLQSHLNVFPEGQFVAIDQTTGEIVGMAASLIVLWDDYSVSDSYHDFTDNSMFTNHDPAGRTVYAAEVMVAPDRQGQGIGRKLYKARRDLVRKLGLLRIRAGARLRGYSAYADQLSPEEYVKAVIRGDIIDKTLTFQLRNGFRVIGVVSDYLARDPASMGHAAIIEWINHKVARRDDYAARDRRFARPRRKRPSHRDG